MQMFDKLFSFIDEYKKMSTEEKTVCNKILQLAGLEFVNGTTIGTLFGTKVIVDDAMPALQPRFIPAKEHRQTMTKVCKRCGKSFITHGPRSLYCSDECRGYREARKDKKHIPKKFRCKCITCGKGFFGKRKDTKYCSFSCVAKHNRPWEKPRNYKKKDSPIKFVPCINCGDIFPTTSDRKICNTCEDLSIKLQQGQQI